MRSNVGAPPEVTLGERCQVAVSTPPSDLTGVLGVPSQTRSRTSPRRTTRRPLTRRCLMDSNPQQPQPEDDWLLSPATTKTETPTAEIPPPSEVLDSEAPVRATEVTPRQGRSQ